MDSRTQECWASQLGDCAGGISREHPVSDGIFEGNSISAFGLSWCKDEPKRIGLPNAVAKILCGHHNTALSPHDAEATRLSRFLAANLRDDPEVESTIALDGSLLEKWSLKTFTNLGYMGALDPLAHRRIAPRQDIDPVTR